MRSFACHVLGVVLHVLLATHPIVEERLEDKDDAEDEEQGQQDGQVFPDVPEALPDALDSELTSALRTRGPNAVDGVPGLLQQPSPGETQCSVPGCPVEPDPPLETSWSSSPASFLLMSALA